MWVESGTRSGVCRGLLGLRPCVVEGADVHERRFWQVIGFAIAQTLEGINRLGQRRGDAGESGELLGHVEGLGQEAFNLPGPGHNQLVLFGKLVHKTALARFSHTMSSLIRTGVPILHAMEIVADTSGNAVVAEAVMASRASVSEGESIAKPMAERSVFPPMVVQMVAVGEETGALDTMLEKIGDFYNDEVQTMVEGLTSLIEPLLIVVLGGVVGGMLISLYLPMFNIINLIQ